MQLDPLGVPLFTGRLAIAMVALGHALFATFIVGASVIGALMETIGYATNSPRHERLARFIAFTIILITAGVSFLGVMLVFLLNVFWPRFWSTLFNIMFGPILLEGGLFLAEAVFAYLWYYSWDRATVGRAKKLHIACGWAAAGSGLAAMLMIDMVASYMLTPQPPEQFWLKAFNPTLPHLHLHRIVGNLTWSGFALAGLCAAGYLRAKNPTEGEFFQWAGGTCFLVGFGALLLMPLIGYHYLLQVRYSEPQAFHTLMLGPRAWLFVMVALLYSLCIVIGSLYIFRTAGVTVESDTMRILLSISFAILIPAGLLFALPYHLGYFPLLSHLGERAVNPLGKMQPNKYIAIGFLVVFGLLYAAHFLRSFWRPAPWWRSDGDPRLIEKAPSVCLLLLTGCAVLLMLTMGWARETARAWNGYLIYGHIELSDERETYGESRDRTGRLRVD